MNDMSEELIHIFDEGKCLTQQQLLDYLNDNMSAAEKHYVEEHLSGCEFCSEALEGLTNIENKERIPLIVQQIRNQMRRELKSHQYKHKKNKYYITLSAIVLFILIILLVAFFVTHYTLRKKFYREHPGKTEQVIPATSHPDQ
jgi:predicted anti-sigma-YlaC factor YlaD